MSGRARFHVGSGKGQLRRAFPVLLLFQNNLAKSKKGEEAPTKAYFARGKAKVVQKSGDFWLTTEGRPQLKQSSDTMTTHGARLHMGKGAQARCGVSHFVSFGRSSHLEL